MSRRSNQKMKILYLAKILSEKTDERHGLTLTQILDELYGYGIEAGRKSLYDDIEALRVFGLDIRTKRDRYVKYYLHNKQFNRTEIRLLSDLIADSKILTETKSKEIAKKLQPVGVVSQNEAVVRSPKAFGEDIYNNVSIICQALELGQRLTFKCFEWNSRKQRILVSGGELFTVSPYKLVFKKGRYLLIAFDHKKHEMAVFNTERIVGIAISGKKSELGKQLFLADEQNINVRLRCDNSVAGALFDKFGTGVTVLANRDEYFEVTLKTDADDDFYSWIFARGGKVHIISPEFAAKKYKEMLSDNMKYAEAVDNEKK